MAGRARIHHCPIEEMPGDEKFDLIVSGLPFNNFSAESVEQILAALLERLAPQGTISFFEYIAVRPARAMLSGPGGTDEAPGNRSGNEGGISESRNPPRLGLAERPTRVGPSPAEIKWPPRRHGI